MGAPLDSADQSMPVAQSQAGQQASSGTPKAGMLPTRGILKVGSLPEVERHQEGTPLPPPPPRSFPDSMFMDLGTGEGDDDEPRGVRFSDEVEYHTPSDHRSSIAATGSAPAQLREYADNGPGDVPGVDPRGSSL